MYEIKTDSLEGTGYRVFKSGDDGFLLYQGALYQLGISFGGLGLIDLETTDLNKDGQAELYFTYSWGSGMHRSQFGCFDPATRETCCPDIHLGNMELALVKEDERLFLERAEVDMEDVGRIDYQVTAFERISELVWQNGMLETSPELPASSYWTLEDGLITYG